MGRLIFRRLVFCLFVLWGVTLITFLLSRVVPGDPARLIAGPRANAAAIAHVRSLYGLDQSLLQQYIHYMGDLLHGNLGTSFMTRRPVVQDLRRYFPATVVQVMQPGYTIADRVYRCPARRARGVPPWTVGRLTAVSASLPSVLGRAAAAAGGGEAWLPVSGRLDAAGVLPHHRALYGRC
jgi:hypothetical protein